MNKSILAQYEFYEDVNGSVFIHIWSPTEGWERSVKWIDLVSRKEEYEHLKIMYLKVRNCHPSLAEKSNNPEPDGITRESLFKYLRKFISYYMADDDQEEPDFVLYTDNTCELNIENITCAINCLALNDIQDRVMYHRIINHVDKDKVEVNQ